MIDTTKTVRTYTTSKNNNIHNMFDTTKTAEDYNSSKNNNI